MSEISSRAAFSQSSRRYIPYIPTLVFALIVVCVTAYQPYRNGPAIRSDGEGYHIWTFALKKWDFNFCEYQALGAQSSGRLGRCFVKWPPGVALFRFPVMAWFVNVNNHESFSSGEHWVSLIFGAGLTVAIYCLGLSTLRRIKLEPLEAQALLFILFFGTGLFHYGTYDNSFSHIYSAFGCAILVWQLLSLAEQREAEVRWWDPWLTGSAAFFMILFRNPNALTLLAYVVLVALQSATLRAKQRLLVGACVGSAAAIGIQLSYNYYASGNLSLSSYLNESFLWDRPMIRSVLFSFERGLFTYYPVVLFGLVFGLWRRASRTLTLVLLSLVLLYATLYGFWHTWYLGGGFGHRGFVDLVPLMVAAIGLGLADIKDRATRRWLLGTASLTVFIPLQVMIGYWRGTFPFEHASEAVYWAHLSDGLLGSYLLAGAVGLFMVTEELVIGKSTQHGAA